MKKIRGIFILLFTLAALAVTAYAAAPTQSGVYDVENLVTGYELTPEKADGTAITKENADINGTKEFYPEAVRFTLKTPKLSGYQLVLALEGGSTTPTEQNIRYIDQKTANNNIVEFEIYPSELKAGQYSICLVGENGTLTKVAGFGYYQAYRLGDANLDKAVNIQDAVVILQYCVGSRSLDGLAKLAADATKDGAVNIQDAVAVLQYCVGSRTLE